MWQVIEDAKKGRAIVLTTHSAEEAHLLSDRIGILAKGRLRCIGPPKRLTSRFGAGFFCLCKLHWKHEWKHSPNNNAVAAPYRKAVKQFFKYVCVTNRGCLHVSLTSQNLVYDFFNVFFQHLDVVPKELNKTFLAFNIPHVQEARLTVDNSFIFLIVYSILIIALTF